MVLAGQNTAGVDHKKDAEQPLGILVGKSTSSLLGPVLVDRHLPPWAPYDETMPPPYVVNKGDTTAVALTKNGWHSAIVPNTTVEWGEWIGSSENAFKIYTSSSDLSQTIDIYSSAYWLTGRRVTDAVIAGMSGTYRYDKTIMLHGNSCLLYVSSSNIMMDIDFSSGDIISGIFDLFVADSGDIWIIDFGGKIRSKDDMETLGPICDISITHATLNEGISVIGAITGSLFGATETANFLGGGFRFQADGDPAKYVGGVYLLGDGAEIASVDARLSGTQIYNLQTNTKFGLLVADSVNNYGLNHLDPYPSEHGVENMPAWQGAAGGWGGGEFVVVTSENGDPRESAFWNNDLQYVFQFEEGKSTPIPLVDGKTMPTGLDAEWGVWDGASNPLHAGIDKNKPEVETAINAPVFWITATPTEAATITNKITASQQSWFNDVAMFGGASNKANVSDLIVNMDLDFSNGKIIDGGFIAEVDLGGGVYDYWKAKFSGDFNENAMLSINIDDSKLLTGTNEFNTIGTIDSFLAGGADLSMVGTFRFEVEFDPTQYVGGVFINSGSDAGDYRYTAHENMMFDEGYWGMAVIAGNESNYISKFGNDQDMFFGGLAVSSDQNGDVMIAAKDSDPSEASWETDPITHVLRRGDAAVDDLGFEATALPEGMEVKWGKWLSSISTPVEAYTDSSDPSQVVGIVDSVYWMVAQATPVENMPSSGMLIYDSVIMAEGMTSIGDIGQFVMNLSVDLDNGGVLHSSYMDIYDTSNNQVWNVTLDGSVKGNILDINAVSGSVSEYAVYNNVVGDVPAVFVGKNGEGIAGSFRLEADGAPSTWTSGVFVVEQQ